MCGGEGGEGVWLSVARARARGVTQGRRSNSTGCYGCDSDRSIGRKMGAMCPMDARGRAGLLHAPRQRRVWRGGWRSGDGGGDRPSKGQCPSVPDKRRAPPPAERLQECRPDLGIPRPFSSPTIPQHARLCIKRPPFFSRADSFSRRHSQRDSRLSASRAPSESAPPGGVLGRELDA